LLSRFLVTCGYYELKLSTKPFTSRGIRDLLIPFAFLFIASFVGHFIVFLSHEILAGFLSNKGANLIV